MAKRALPVSTALFPVPVALVTSLPADGKPNIVTLAWVGILNSEPPIIYAAIRRGRYSHPAVDSRREFVLNIASEGQLEAAEICGTLSGRDTNKWEVAKLTPVPAEKVGPPLIAECPVNLECKVRDVLHFGSHDVFIADVVAVHANEDCVDESGKFIVDNIKALSFFPAQYWATGKKLADRGFWLKKQKQG